MYGTANAGTSVKMYGRNGMKEGSVISRPYRYTLPNLVDDQGIPYQIEGIKVGYYADLGDSGGVVVTANDVRIMVGMQSARSSDPSNPYSLFTDAASILSGLDATLPWRVSRIEYQNQLTGDTQ